MMRPILFVPVWGFALLGYYKAGYVETGKVPIWNVDNSFLYLLLKISVFSLSVGAVNIFNQIADKKADEINDGFSILNKIEISNKLAFVVASIIAAISILIPLYFKWDSIYIFSISAVLIGFVYSFPPTYFTGRPFVDFITNAIGFGIIAFGVGWTLNGQNFQSILIPSTPYFLMMCAGSISSTLPDIKGDLAGGKLTTAVLLGDKNANLLATFFICLTIVISVINKDFVSLAAGVISFPVYFIYAINKSELFREATYKVGGAMLMAIVALMYPLFIPFSVLLFVLTIIYFRLRFQVAYPSLLPIKN